MLVLVREVTFTPGGRITKSMGGSLIMHIVIIGVHNVGILQYMTEHTICMAYRVWGDVLVSMNPV